MGVVDASFDNPLKSEERAAMPLMGGLMTHGFQCGMLWGAALAAGAQSYQLFGASTLAESRALIASQRLVESFQSRYNYIDCIDITEVEFRKSSKSRLLKQISKFVVKKGGPIGCFRMAASYAPVAFREIDRALVVNSGEMPSRPVSCSAMVAQKMGVSEMHGVMAAGLAGGIGLSGGACGALGAAIWLSALKCLEEGEDNNIWNSELFQSSAADTIERFLQSADYEFECSKIAGRRFAKIDDHAAYLAAGGCSEIIEALSMPIS